MVFIFFSCAVLLFLSSQVQSQITPSHYLYSTGEIVSVNGSDVNGRCTTSPSAEFGSSFTECTAPNTSILFDGNVPTLTGLDGEMWASQLLTLQSTNPTAQLVFDFTATPDYSRVEEVEVVILNCPQWGISAGAISVSVGSTLSGIGAPIATVIPTITSCDYLVKVRIAASTAQPALRLEFSLPVDSDWVHLAEVKFYGNPGSCTSDTITTPPTTPPATTPATAISSIKPPIKMDDTRPPETPFKSSDTKPRRVTPLQYACPIDEVVSINGSSADGRCTRAQKKDQVMTCLEPATSVLFDGNVPTLTGLDSDMWASQLLTLQTTDNHTNLTFNFTNSSDYVGIGSVDVIMFNCPSWGISSSNLTIFGFEKTSSKMSHLADIASIKTSCSSLVTASATINSHLEVFTLHTSSQNSSWVYFAEVSFSRYRPSHVITSPQNIAIIVIPVALLVLISSVIACTVICVYRSKRRRVEEVFDRRDNTYAEVEKGGATNVPQNVCEPIQKKACEPTQKVCEQVQKASEHTEKTCEPAQQAEPTQRACEPMIAELKERVFKKKSTESAAICKAKEETVNTNPSYVVETKKKTTNSAYNAKKSTKRIPVRDEDTDISDYENVRGFSRSEHAHCKMAPEPPAYMELKPRVETGSVYMEIKRKEPRAANTPLNTSAPTTNNGDPVYVNLIDKAAYMVINRNEMDDDHHYMAIEKKRSNAPNAGKGSTAYESAYYA